MKKTLLGILITLIALLACNSEPNSLKINKGKSHSIPALKIELNDYNWNVEKDKYGVPAIVMRHNSGNDSFLESVNIVSKYSGNNTKLKELVSESIHELSHSLKGFELIKSSMDTIDNIQFQKINYQILTEKGTLKLIQYIGLKNNLQYVITGTATIESFDYYENQLNTICKSIKFKTIDKNSYINSDLGISLVNKSNWQIIEKYQNIPLFLMSPLENERDNFQENINIVSENIGEYSLTEYYIESIKGLESYAKNLQIINKPIDVEINGVPFKKASYSHTLENLNLHVLVYFTSINGKGYVINCSSKKEDYKKYEPKFEEIVQSIKLLK